MNSFYNHVSTIVVSASDVQELCASRVVDGVRFHSRVVLAGENIKHLYVYDMVDGLPINRKLIYDFKPFFSDGFRCDKDGNVWTSAGKAIKCFNPQNELIGQLIIPELVSNLEFGGEEGNILFITATTSLYSIELNQQGARFYE